MNSINVVNVKNSTCVSQIKQMFLQLFNWQYTAEGSFLTVHRPLIAYLRKFYYYDPEEEINPTLKERGQESSSQPGVESQT